MRQEDTYTALFGSGEVYLLIGAMLATALFFLTIYFGLNRKRSYLFFSSYALLGALSLLLLKSNHVLSFLIAFTLACLCLLYFFGTFFNLSHSTWIAGFAFGLSTVTVAGVAFFDERNETIFLIIAWLTYALTLMACSWISLRAINRKRYGGKLLFSTTALIFFLSVVLVSDSFFLSSISIASCTLILAVAYTVLQDVHQQNKLVRSLKFKAVHLENELLKKHIQPHFLINTLTVLSEWIEERPALAVKQIDLLSEEFRYITRVAGETVIPIEEELRICQVHLDMFNAKQTSHFNLEAKNITADTTIPPMIFHTLIENGLTHADTDQGRFLIEQHEAGDEIRFRISAEPLVKQTADEDGIGLSYIKSRLEQAYPGKWRMTSEAKNGAWETLIAITK